MEHNNPQPSDEERIHAAIAEWRENGSHGTIDAVTARIIASRWHGGQISALYSFQTTGKIDLEQLSTEMLQNVVETLHDPEAQEELEALGLYFLEVGDRERVEGWATETRWS